MDDFTPLSRPSQSQISIEPVAKECPSEGFEYPTFRQLNKQARVYVSQRLNPNASTYHHLFTVANLKGWFAAVQSTSTGSAIVLSTLEDLRAAFGDAKEDSESLFTPKRTLRISPNTNIINFAYGDTRLLVGLENGSLAVYDTASLFSSGTDEVAPLKTTQIQDAALGQIVPNPGTEPALSELVAIVGDGKVALLNMNLEPQGGWAASDLMTQPISVAWSPKGKHLAVGLQTGDILTFALTNKSTPHKHIPPTADAILVSLNWLGPGHTFRTSYGAQGGSPAKQHIIVLDTKSSTASYFAPDHPFPAYGRTQQNAYTLNLPRWDEDATSSGEEPKSLTVVGDFSSVDIEILGNKGNQWFRQSQDNPLSLPLDSAMDDTILLALEADLTDTSAAAPIVYAYLNDGSIQGWHAEHSKPYLGLVGAAAESIAQSSSTSTVQESRDTEMNTEAPPTPATTNPTSSPFSSTQPSSTFGSQTTSPFGQTTPAFGQSSFGQPSAFGQPSSTPSAFSGFSQTTPAAAGSSGFGAFAGSGSGAFGSTSSFAGFRSTPPAAPAFGQTGFGSSPSPPVSPPAFTRETSMADDTGASVAASGFGGLGLGSSTPTDSSKSVNSMFGTFGGTTTTTTPATNTFGSATSSGGGFLKPATGFGAFGGGQTTGSFDPANKPSTTMNAFSQIAAGSGLTTTPTPGSGFGQSGFGKSSFRQPALGQSAFGKTGFGASIPNTTPSSSGGFSAFASTPTSFGATVPQSSEKPLTTGGFAGFASSTPSAFGTSIPAAPATGLESKPATTGFSAFAGAPSAFGPASTPKSESTTLTPQLASTPGGAFSAFGPKPAESTTPKTSVFGTPFAESSTPIFGSTGFGTNATPSTVPKEASTKPIVLSPPSSPETSQPTSPFGPPTGVFGSTSTTPKASPASGGAFGGLQATPSAFKPATGFGAFGSSTSGDSPFFKKSDPVASTPSAFPAVAPSAPPTANSGTATTTTPTFGSTSKLGAGQSTFGLSSPVTPTPAPKTVSTTPTTTPGSNSGAFSAFAGSSGGFSAFTGQKKSFSELLKSREENKDVEKSSASASPFATPAKEDKGNKDTLEQRTSVFGTPKADGGDKKSSGSSVFQSITNRDEGENPSEPVKKTAGIPEEPSYGNISASSAASSYVEIEGEEERREEEGSDEDGDHQDDQSDFLTDEDELSDGSEEGEGSVPEDGGGGSEEEESEGEEERPTSQPSPTAIPLPASRSPSETPQPEVPRIEVSESPERRSPSPSPKPSFVREPSTTPPGTPTKESKSPFGNSSSSTSFGIGIGRPSTRPARSSPLANAVILDEEGEEETKKRAAQPSSDTSPSPPEVSGERSPKRPKTPPLLSTMGPKSSGALPTPSITPPSSEGTSTPSFEPKVQKPATNSPTTSSAFFGFGQPASASFELSTNTGNLLGKPLQAPASTTSAPTQPMPPSSSSGFFGSKATVPGAPTVSNVFGMPAFSFGVQPAPSSQALSLGPSKPSGFFGAPSQPSQQGFPTPPNAQPSSQSQELFGRLSKQPFNVGPSQPPMFSSTQPKLATQPSAPLFGAKPPVPTPPPAKTQEEMLEEGMQKECVNLLKSVARDLEMISKTGSNARHMLSSVNVSLGGSRNKADLGNPSKWGLADLEQFARVLKQYERDLEAMETEREKEKQILKEIQSNMLKAGTRREEIARFNRAKDDKEFAKMLKARTLGPEHSETQTHLRKSIRAIRDRVQKLEKRLQDDKKKLASAQSCKPRIKAPSLDTINRTYRNIDIAIEQQTDDVNRLGTRVSKISIADAQAASAASAALLLQRDSRLPDLPSSPLSLRKPINVTPNVAVTTAAALNAEHSAARLKKALLAVRKQPLLNDKVTREPTAPTSFTSPSKGDKPGNGQALLKGFENLKGPLFSESAEKVSQGSTLGLKDWDIGEDRFDPSGSGGWAAGGSSGRRGKKSHHSSGLGHGASHGQPFRRSAGSEDEDGVDIPSTTAAHPTSVSPPVAKAPVTFDWGPLPNFGAPSPTPTKAIEPPKQIPKGFVSFSTVSSGSSTAVSTPTPSLPFGSALPTPTSFAKPAGTLGLPPQSFFNTSAPSNNPTSAPPKGFFSITQASSPGVANTPSPASTATLSPLATPAIVPKGFFSFSNAGSK
ncbi:hypothetical protein CPB83DRAFT_857976 [Crepidotus variabilis]|uniref:Nucleoporin Nup159/Nup146 N-terminal domain-containing protein n=1 Tax=Crepidotus variabilis TaxID=179855 RepID=A0A9P6ECA5_9AGAR|nr:hypothetical protein CPB83DRAFT_857976 [Crepidotus variabilis]